MFCFVVRRSPGRRTTATQGCLVSCFNLICLKSRYDLCLRQVGTCLVPANSTTRGVQELKRISAKYMRRRLSIQPIQYFWVETMLFALHIDCTASSATFQCSRQQDGTTTRTTSDQMAHGTHRTSAGLGLPVQIALLSSTRWSSLKQRCVVHSFAEMSRR